MGAELRPLGTYFLPCFPERGEAHGVMGSQWGTEVFPTVLSPSPTPGRESGGGGTRRAGGALRALACIICFIAVVALVTTAIHHSLRTAAKLAQRLLEQRAEVPISPQSTKPSSPKSLFIPLSFIFFFPFFFLFMAALMSFHFHSGAMKATANYAKLQVREAPSRMCPHQRQLGCAAHRPLSDQAPLPSKRRGPFLAINGIPPEADGSAKLSPAAAGRHRLRREALWAPEPWGGKGGVEHRTGAVLRTDAGMFVLAEGAISSFF